MTKSKKTASRKKSSVKVQDLGAKSDPAGGATIKEGYLYQKLKGASIKSSTDGSLDAGVHFKYDVKTLKES